MLKYYFSYINIKLIISINIYLIIINKEKIYTKKQLEQQMLPKLQLPNTKLTKQYISKQQYVQDHHILATHMQKLTNAITNLYGFLQNNINQRKQQQYEKVKEKDKNLNLQQQKDMKDNKIEISMQQNVENVTQNNKIQNDRLIEDYKDNEDRGQKFRWVVFEIKKITQDTNRQKEIFKFLANLLSKVLTQGFNYYEQGLFNDKKYRKFCCSNIIYKIMEFARINQISEKQFKLIDAHLAKKVLPYQKYNYPKTQSQQINLKLSQIIYQINNLQQNQNNLVFQSKIKFSKKNSGDYTAEIMKLINFLIDKIRKNQKIQVQGEQEQQETLAESFFKQMSSFFGRVYNERWVTKAKKNDPSFNFSLQQIEKNKQEEQAQKSEEYEKKVQSYTKYEIGIKISQNLSKYTEQNIAQQNFQLSNSGMMRVLTKWSQELEQYIYNTNQKIINRQENFIMMDGSEGYLNNFERLNLAVYLKDQIPQIENYLQEINKNMSKNKVKAIKSDKVSQFEEFAIRKQADVGCFSTMVHKSNANYLINYLNKLIDCILTAQKQWSINYNYEQQACSHLVPSLISLRIGDLMRCRICSKQKEITALFNYLNFMNKNHPEIIQIIRIKNKLRQGTKDVLINLRFKKAIIVQMQLAIQQDKSTFIQCSEKANHFIYELERARFGPIAQMCNLWSINDQTSKYFSKAFEEVKPKLKKNQFKMCGHRKKEEKFPIWCQFCQGFVPNLSIITSHLKCQQCNIQYCYNCLCKYGTTIISNGKKIEEQTLVNGKQKNDTYKILTGIDINKKIKAQKQYLLLRIKNQYTIFQNIKQRQYQLKLETQNKKKVIKYFSNIIIINSILGQSNEILNYLKDQYYRKYFQKAKTKMSRTIIYEGKINLKIIQNSRYPYVKKLCLIDAKLVHIGQLPTIFPVCQIAVLNKNRISNFKNIQKWKSLTQLFLQENEIAKFPQQILQLTNLKKLNLYQNKIKVLPDKIDNLSNLNQLILAGNYIVYIPQSLGNLTKLKELSIMWNKIQSLPQNLFQNMKDLKKLHGKQNKITVFPTFLNKLQNIEQIMLACNNIKQIKTEDGFSCRKLKMFLIRNNKITVLPSFRGTLQSLEQISFQKNKISSVENGQWECRNLKILNLNMNQLQVLPYQLGTCKQLQILRATNNRIQKFQEGPWQLNKLKILMLAQNKFTAVPKIIGSFQSLQDLNLSNNPLKQFQPGEWKCLQLEQFNLLNTEICLIPNFIKNLKKMKQLQLSSKNNLQLQLPQQLLQWPQQLILILSNNYTIKAGCQKVYDELNSKNKIKRK